MGITNIRCGYDLLDRGDGVHQDQIAIIPQLGERPLQIVSTANLPQEELDRYIDLFHWHQHNIWLRRSVNGAFEGAQPDHKFIVPTATLTPGLRDFQNRVVYGIPRKVGEPSPRLPPLDVVYILVVQGLSGAAVSKLRMEWRRDTMGSVLMQEVLSGYSVVFSGAMLKSDVKKLGQKKYNIIAVSDFEETGREDVIQVVC